MINDIILKIRALTEDFGIMKTETYEIENSAILTLCGKVQTITSVTLNGIALGSGEYSFDENTNDLTIIEPTNSGDIVIVKYKAYKLSDSEILEYIRASLVWLSYFSWCSDDDFELESEIVPTPTNKEEDLIALIASILIQPDYSSYRLPTVSVSFPLKMDKKTRIEKLISQFKRSLGATGVLIWEEKL